MKILKILMHTCLAIVLAVLSLGLAVVGLVGLMLGMPLALIVAVFYV